MLRSAVEEQQHGRMMRASTMTDSQHDSEKHLKTAEGIKDSQQDSKHHLVGVDKRIEWQDPRLVVLNSRKIWL